MHKHTVTSDKHTRKFEKKKLLKTKQLYLMTRKINIKNKMGKFTTKEMKLNQ